MAGKKSKGRQKLEMVKMKNEVNLQVTFSKRRFGLFKKASELVSLCGAEVALIVFSPGGKVYTFGHPTVQAIIQRYLGGGVGSSSGVGPSNVAAGGGDDGLDISADGAQRAMLSARLGHELSDKESQLEREKKVGEILGEKIKNSPLYKRWGKASVDEMDMSELLEFKAALEKLKMDIDAMKMKKSMEMLNQMMARSSQTPGLYFGGNDSFVDDPCFGFNYLNPNNDANFLPPVDPFFAPFPNHQNLGEELLAGEATMSAGGVTTLAVGGTTLAAGATTLAAEGDTISPREGTTLVGGATGSTGGGTTLAGGTTASAGADTTLAGGATTSAKGDTTVAGGATTFASSSYPPPGFLY